MRRLIVCLDGTWASPNNLKETDEGYSVFKPSNVLKLYRAVKPRAEDGVDQISFYDEGVGGLKGGIWGKGFAKNVTDAYNFLAGNYLPGDEIFAFGFSRGAAEARSLCRFIDWVGGILTKGDTYYIPECFARFATTQAAAGTSQHLFDEINTRGRSKIQPPQKAEIRFLGAFDTVLSLGSRFKVIAFSPDQTTEPELRFHVGESPPGCVRTARHALAIDEKRKVFVPEIWHKPASSRQSLEQRWFAGVHTDVGGGYSNDGLANVALHWMADEARSCGLDCDERFLGFYKPWVGDERHESLRRFYKIRGPRLRDLNAAPEGNLDLHPSVLELLQISSDDPEDQRYRPPNLLSYLAKRSDLLAALPANLAEEVRRLA